MPSPAEVPPSPRTLRTLDAVNFLMADVETGVGPFLAIYLSASLHWAPGEIGLAMAAGGFAAIAAQAPMGLLVDRLRHKREALAAATAVVVIACSLMPALRGFAGIIAAQVLLGAVGSFFPPAMAGMTLGIVGPSGLDRRIGRNESFNHAGNVFTATAAGLIGYWLARRDIFFFVAAMGVVTIAALFFIRREDIDFERARGARRGAADGARPSALADVLRHPPLLVFVLAVVLFHFANAAMLPLLGQRLSAGHPRESSLYMAVCIIGAQLVMIPVALAAGRAAHRWGRKAVFLVAFVVLPLRGLLSTLSDNAPYLIAVQLLDGVGAGIFGVVNVLVIADLTRGTGRFNATLGLVATATALGAVLSNSLAGYAAQHAGYPAAFLFLAGVAAAGGLLFWRAMPETKA